jgi:hypothetical protein
MFFQRSTGLVRKSPRPLFFSSEIIENIFALRATKTCIRPADGG